MKFGRFHPLDFSLAEKSQAALAGIVEGSHVSEILGDFSDKPERTGRAWPLERVRFTAPTSPSKIVCVGRNYQEHAQELGNEVPKQPLIFFKPPSSIIASGETIVLPPASQRVDYEGELALIIGRKCRHFRAGDAVRPFILGYTALNDVTARDLQKPDWQWTRAKGFDTFCPVGPIIETDLPSPETTVETFVNGVKKQSGRVDQMIFPIPVVLAWITAVMTLLPGDIIATGTPSGVGPLAAGDVVEVAVSEVGILRNPVSTSSD